MNRRIRFRTYGGVEGRELKGSPLSDRRIHCARHEQSLIGENPITTLKGGNV